MAWALAVCAVSGGCGKKGGTLLIGGTAEASAEAVSEESQASEVVPASSEEGKEEEDKMIRVYVCGAVANPGVVEIAAGSRAEDALSAAGGFSAEAAREAVNLAEWVNDGQKLYFPAEGEEYEPDSGSGGASGSEGASGLVNINTADSAALCTLPGVGESRAADIIAYREANGGFESCEDIMKVPGIKNAMYEKIRDKITVK